jgi:hypothetical protein
LPIFLNLTNDYGVTIFESCRWLLKIQFWTKWSDLGNLKF